MQDRKDNERNETLARSQVNSIKQHCDILFSELNGPLMEIMNSNSGYRSLLKKAEEDVLFSANGDALMEADPTQYDTHLANLRLLEVLKVKDQLDPVKDKALISVIEKVNLAKQLYDSLNVEGNNQAKIDSFKKTFNEKLPKLSGDSDSLFRKFIEAVKKILKIKSNRAVVKDATQKFLSKSSMFAGSDSGGKRDIERGPENNGPTKRQRK